MELHERGPCARTVLVDRLRDELFAGSALARHEDARATGGDLLDDAEDRLHRRARPDDVRKRMTAFEAVPRIAGVSLADGVMVIEALSRGSLTGCSRFRHAIRGPSPHFILRRARGQ